MPGHAAVRGYATAAARVLAIGLLLGSLVLLFAFGQARQVPVVRRAVVGLGDWPTTAPPITVALLSDIHLGNAAMDETRLGMIVDQINRQHPDLILLAGDFIAGHRDDPDGLAARPLTASLRRLQAPLGVMAVLGNHDHWRNAAAVTAALRHANIVVLSNAATKRGPLVIGGLDDDFTHHARAGQTLAAMAAFVGPRLILSHSPDPAARIAPPLLFLAGHTHCGQITLPIVGRLVSVSRLGDRYACGWVREPGRDVFITAGLGTSILLLRLGAPPDMWLITLGPRTRR